MSLTSRLKKQSINQQERGFKRLLSSIGIRKKIGFGYALTISIASFGVLTGLILEFNYKYQVRSNIGQGKEKAELLTRITKKVLKVILINKEIILIQKDFPINNNNLSILEKQISLELSSFYEVNTIFKQLESILNTRDESVYENMDYLQLQEFIQTYFNPLKVHIQQLENLVQEIKQISPQTKVESSPLVLLSEMTSSQFTMELNKLSQDSEKLAILAHQRVEQEYKDYQKVEELETQISVASLLLSVITAVIIAIYATNSITTPLKVITKVAEQVTEEANFELQLPVSTNDEIGELTVSLNELIGKVAEYTEQLQEAKLKAEAANRSKSAFLATMSHELRTPLNAIIGYSDLLYEDALEAGYEDFIPDLERIKLAGTNLLEMISDILDISKIEAGQVTLYLESIEVNKLVEDMFSTAKNLTEKNRNKFELLLGENLGSMYADIPKVRQILMNLLGNAAKFTEDGVITLSAEKVKNNKQKNNQNHNTTLLSNENNYIVFRVIDTGIGMTEEQLKHIFKPFTQADASTTRRYGGTGLGLAICQRLCERMGAEITVKSEFGKGSTFTVWFPERVLI